MNIKKIIKISIAIIVVIAITSTITNILTYPSRMRTYCSAYAADFAFDKNNYTDIKMWYDLLYNRCLHEKGLPAESGYSSTIK